jgi:ketosteroid isomerase-like protein
MTEREIPPPRASVREAVLAANAAFYEAFEGLNLEWMGRVWSETMPVSCVHPGWALVAGRAAVLASWAGIFRGTDRIRFELREPEVFIAGQAAWVVLVESLEAEHAGTLVRALAHTTNMFLLEEAGWRLVHHHAAPVTQEPAQPDAPPARVLH